MKLAYICNYRLNKFIKIFQQKGLSYKFSLLFSKIMILILQNTFLNKNTQKSEILELFKYQTIEFNLKSYLISFLFKFRLLFYFFYQKTNKRIYKFARYKLPKYSIKYFYIRPRARFQKFLFVIKKTFLITYKPNLSFRKNLYYLIFVMLNYPRSWIGYQSLKKTHTLLYKTSKNIFF